MFTFMEKIRDEHQQKQAAKQEHSQKDANSEPVVDIAGIDPNRVEALRIQTTSSALSARAIAEEQKEAVSLVEKEAGTYQKKPPGGITWQDLALLAVNIATAGVGAMVATWATPALNGVLGKSGVAKIIGTEALTNAISEGIQSGFAETAGAAAKSGVDAAFDNKKEDKQSTSYSSNARLDFFAAHASYLREAAGRYEAAIIRQQTLLQPLLRTDPEAALEVMRRMGAAFQDRKVRKQAFDQQALATSTQWASGIAQGVAGKKQRMNLDLSATTVTDFSKGYGVAADKRFARGLLRLAVRLIGNKIEVTSAAIDGVAQEIADRFSNEPIEHLKIPVRVAVTHLPDGMHARIAPMDLTHQAWITRDESGSIRVKGEMGTGKGTDLEAATTLCNELFRRPLTQWGVKSINTDDASGRG